jgi:prepilin-type N-terminal cleavage/methylation domain-containing protein
MVRKAGFTLIDLVVTILIVGILAAALVPSMQGRIDKAKWSEANAMAGAIRRAVRAYASETDTATARYLAGMNLMDPPTQQSLGFTAADLEGKYFTAGDYTLTSIDDSAVAVVTVASSKPEAPSGSYRLLTDGEWVKLN